MERDGFRLSSAVPKIQWDSNPHCPLRLLGYGKPLPLAYERRRSRVVRAAWLVCRSCQMPKKGRQFEAGLRHPTT